MSRWDKSLHLVETDRENLAEDILLSLYQLNEPAIIHIPSELSLFNEQESLKNRLFNLELLTILRFLNSDLPLKLKMERLMDGLMTIYGAQKGFVAFVKTNGTIKIEITRNFSEEHFKTGNYNYVQEAVKLAIQGKSIIYFDAANELEIDLGLWLDDIPVDNLLCAPITTKDKIHGVFYVENFALDFDRRQLEEFAQISAHLSAIAINQGIANSPFRKEFLTKSAQDEKPGATDLAEKIGHDLNNKIAAIRGNLDLAKKALERDKDTMQALRRIAQVEKLVEKIAQYSFSLLNKGRIEQKLMPCNINQLINDFIYTIEPVYRGSGVKLSKKLSSDLPSVNVDKSQIEQVLFNIVINAIEARTDVHVVLKTEYNRRHNVIVLRIIDNGPGIAKENISKIFQPFFTTKPNGHGFGLHICREIINNHGGSISVRSKIGRGTEFVINLPCS